MLTTLRRERRTRRQANFNLESLDDRLLLSAGAGGAVAAEAAGATAAAIEHRQEVRLARHEAKLARMAAQHEAKLARMAAPHPQVTSSATTMAMMIPASASVSGSASASSPAAAAAAVSAPSTSAAPAASPASNTSLNPGSHVPSYPVTTPSSGTGTTTTGSGSSSNSGSTSGSPGPLPANVAAALQSLYQEYESAGGGSSFTPSQPSDKLLQISGTSVMVDLKIASSSDFNTALSQLQSDGMNVSTSSAAYGLVDGMVPIADLPAIAQVAASVTAAPPPVML